MFTVTGSGESVLVIERSATALATVVVVVALLLVVLGSDGLPVTETVLVRVPVELGLTTMVTVALAPLFRFPRGQVTTRPADEQLP